MRPPLAYIVFHLSAAAPLIARLLQSLAALILFSLPSVYSHAQDVTAYEEQYKLIKAPRAATTLGPDLFGDSVNLYNGRLSFAQTDVSLRGNNALPVSVGRRIGVGASPWTQRAFGAWELDIPHLHGVFSARDLWTASPSGARCSSFNMPQGVSGFAGRAGFEPLEFWQGSFMYIPGAGDQELLSRTDETAPSPGPKSVYPVVTSKFWFLSCLPALANGTGSPRNGEGFLALSPDGTKYYFDWMAEFPTSSLKNAEGSLTRSEVWIMPSRVVDKFGNTVVYTYDSANRNRLLSIESLSDQRKISLTYNAGGQVDTVSDGTHVWHYNYDSVSAGADLVSVVLPDGSSWDFSNLRPLYPQAVYGGLVPCDAAPLISNPAQGVSGSIKHPTGATATFELTPVTHGRSHVPRYCDPQYNNDRPDIPRFYVTMSLTRKIIAGAGFNNLEWRYDYGPANESWDSCVSCISFTPTLPVRKQSKKLEKFFQILKVKFS